MKRGLKTCIPFARSICEVSWGCGLPHQHYRTLLALSRRSPAYCRAMRWVEATFDFQGTDGQLTFSAGEVIAVVNQGEPNEWWEGEVRGVRGWFPSGFCSAPFDEGIEQETADGQGKRYAMALYAYQGSTPDELSFSAGDVIEVTDCEQAWWSGSLAGTVGVFPGNFVEMMADSAAAGGAGASKAGGTGMVDLSKALGAAVSKARSAKDDGSGRATEASDASGASGATASESMPQATFVLSSSHAGNWDKHETGDASGWATAKSAGSDLCRVGYAERPVDATSYRSGSRHVWQHAAFADVRARTRLHATHCVASAPSLRHLCGTSA